jgi:hypothetical protein
MPASADNYTTLWEKKKGAARGWIKGSTDYTDYTDYTEGGADYA